ncbi:hypothetical protein ACFSTC_19400 [Nonomuraea ferruginea]
MRWHCRSCWSGCSLHEHAVLGGAAANVVVLGIPATTPRSTVVLVAPYLWLRYLM